MIIPIVGASALEFWLSGVSRKKESILKQRVSIPENCCCVFHSDQYELVAQKLCLSLPLHVMTGKASERRKNGYVHSIKCPSHLPDNSFIKLDNNIYVSSPELCFVQMAKLLPIAKLVELADDLCGIYALDKNSNYEQISSTQIVTVKTIIDFIQRAIKYPGVKKARQAIQYAVDGSNSPRESMLVALSVLHLSLGGYGLSKPEANKDIWLPDDVAEFFGRQSCCCDLVWEKQKVVVEYDSNLSHLSVKQHTRDKRRYNALNMAGYHVFSITAEDMKSFKDIEKTFLSLRKILGFRADTSTLAKYETIRWKTVHTIVFDSWRSYL